MAGKHFDYPDSYYAATANASLSAPSLGGSDAADVCVIGGGYAGLSAALHLRERGYDVVLVEAGCVGRGASGRNGGQIGSGQRQDEAWLEKKLGGQTARLLWNMAEEAKATVRGLVDKHRIDCDLTPGQLVTAVRAPHADYLEQRAQHLTRNYGYRKIRYVDKPELEEMLGSRAFFGATLDEGAAHLHPLNFALGLAAACRQAGVRIYEHSAVTSYAGTSPVTVLTADGAVAASHVVIACNGYLGNLEPRIAGHIMPINNFVLATAPLDSNVATSLIRDNVCVHDTRFVVNYFRLSGDRRLLFGGGETYTRKYPADLGAFVRPHMLKVFPQLDATPIDYAWGGTLAITMNRLPHVGKLGPNLYFAQGFSGHGIANATFAGRLIAEAVAGSAEHFDIFANLPVGRFPGGTWLRWPGQVAGMLWYALRDRL